MSTNRASQSDKPIRSEPFSYSFWPMAVATSAFILPPRRFGFRNPGHVYGDVEDPGDHVSLEEQILCTVACGIRSNPIWNPIVS
jgi:hypothetical protein